MEAGRAVQRGLVTPDRTTLIASTHRVYAMTEKIALADGRVDSAALDASCRGAAKRFIGFDMEALAEATGSVISAVLFGALAGSGVLPFQRTAYEAAVRRGGVGVSQSLAAFSAGFAGVDGAPAETDSAVAEPELSAELRPLVVAIEGAVPADALDVIRAGIARLADYQDNAYARAYLECLRPFIALARAGDGGLLAEVARQLALAMSYEDTIRVAELKTRSTRFERVRTEMQLKASQLLEVAEFMHPRAQEIADTLPAPVGRWLLRSTWARPLLDSVTRSGRVVKTTSVGGFLLLRAIAALKPLRPRSLRYAREQHGLAEWLQTVARTAEHDRELAIEVARARGLVKGYGDTYERGLAKFDLLLGALSALIGRQSAAATFAELRKAALADEDGAALRKAIETSDAIPGALAGSAAARSMPEFADEGSMR
jgi:indolepyruvate ferredoxin oxidoreductase beta subunit